MPEFGSTICEIEDDGFKPHVIRSVYKRDVKASMASFAGELTQKLSAKLVEIKPDLVLVLGDRAEMLAGAIAGTYLGIPVAHSMVGILAPRWTNLSDMLSLNLHTYTFQLRREVQNDLSRWVKSRGG